MSDKKIKGLREKYLWYLKAGNREAANAVRLQLNRLVMRPYRDRSQIFVGNDKYFVQEGAVTGSGSAKSIVLVEARDEE